MVRALDDLLRLAVEQRATDLHIEPFGGALQVRLRIDGLLKALTAPPASMTKGILSRLKIMAGLNITERRLPQDGRARIVVGGAEIDLRVATMPTMHGESAVVRLLRKGSGFVALDKVGLSRARRGDPSRCAASAVRDDHRHRTDRFRQDHDAGRVAGGDQRADPQDPRPSRIRSSITFPASTRHRFTLR